MSFIRFMRIFAFVLILIGLNSCFKDVDLERASEITFGPTIMMDLLTIDFAPPAIPAQEVGETIEHEINLEFLPNDIGDNLESLNLNMDYSNTLARPFVTTIIFHQGDKTIYELNFFNEAGNPGALDPGPVLRFIEEIPVDVVERATRALVQVQIQSGAEVKGGRPRLKARAHYKFNF